MTKQGSLQKLSAIFKRKNQAVFFTAMFLTVSLCGNVNAMEKAEGEPVREMDIAEKRILGERLVSAIVNSYKGYNRAGFTDDVSENFTPDRSVFVGESERTFYAAMPLKIDCYVNTVTYSDGKLAVSFRWNKTAVVRGKGNVANSSGESVFVFEKRGKDWLLCSVKGRSPFSE